MRRSPTSRGWDVIGADAGVAADHYRLLAAVATYGLPGSGPLPQSPLDDESFATLLDGCERHRLFGLLGAAVRARDFHLTASQRQGLETILQGWLGHALRLEQLLGRAHECLRAERIEHRILKGAALAHTVYDEPSWRVFGDVDVLVRSSAFPRAARVLAAQLDLRRATPERQAGFDARFGSAVELRKGRLELDLHRTLVNGALGLTVVTDELFAEPLHFNLAGRELQTLAAPQQLIHACYAAVLGNWPSRLSAQRDVVQVYEGLRPDPDATLRIAQRWGATAVVARGLAQAWEDLGLSGGRQLVEWARRYRPRPLERLLMASYRGAGRGYTIQVVAPLVIPGLRAKLAFTRGIVFPQRAFLDRRKERWTGFARRALSRMWDWPSRAWFDG